MKQIIVFILINIFFIFSINAQIIEQYVDEKDEGLTVIEKVPQTNNQVILNTLDIEEYTVGDVIFIKDHLTESQKEEPQEVVQEIKATDNIQQQNVVIYYERVERPATREKADSPERNPIGEKVKNRQRRAPRWKSDRRRKRSISNCFKF